MHPDQTYSYPPFPPPQPQPFYYVKLDFRQGLPSLLMKEPRTRQSQHTRTHTDGKITTANTQCYLPTAELNQQVP